MYTITNERTGATLGHAEDASNAAALCWNRKANESIELHYRGTLLVSGSALGVGDWIATHPQETSAPSAIRLDLGDTPVSQAVHEAAGEALSTLWRKINPAHPDVSITYSRHGYIEIAAMPTH